MEELAPRLDCCAQHRVRGGYTPVLGAGGANYGRYLYLPDQRLCHFSFGMWFGNVGNTVGGGSQNIFAGNYLVELPVPARNYDGGNTLIAPGDRNSEPA